MGNKLFVLRLFVNINIVFSISQVNSLRLDRDLPCAAGISTIPPLDNLRLPMDRFPDIIPSGVNVCDATCGSSSKCTYNWLDSLGGFPFLLYRCQCPKSCPPPKMLYAGYLQIFCQDVTKSKSRCICPYGKSTFRCIISILPFQQKNPYYCACCNGHQSYY